jgi:hypothetical protein
MIYGESGSGKSFVVLDMVLAVARGVEWRGLRTKPGRVAYVVAEGGGGFPKRIKAYGNHHGVDVTALPFSLLNAAPNFTAKADVGEVIRGIQAAGGADIIVVDTLAQVTPGANENAGEDMGRVIAHCKALHKHTRATVLLVHHAGKDASRGARGWSGMKAAMDAEIEVTRGVAGRKVKLTKQKDGEDGLEFGFELQRVIVGMDEDGDVIESAVVIEADAPETQMTQVVGKQEKLIISVVNGLAVDGVTTLEIDTVLSAVVSRMPRGAGERDRRKEVARTALRALSAGKYAIYREEGTRLEVLP